MINIVWILIDTSILSLIFIIFLSEVIPGTWHLREYGRVGALELLEMALQLLYFFLFFRGGGGEGLLLFLYFFLKLLFEELFGPHAIEVSIACVVIEV